MQSGRIVVSAAVTVAVGCSHTTTAPDMQTTNPFASLPACGAATLLSVSPVAYGDIREIAPMGNLNPSAHTFPTDHIYLYGQPAAVMRVVAPGAIRVTTVLSQKRTGGGAPELDDYGLDFAPCAGEHFSLGHLTSLAPSLLNPVAVLDSRCNPAYSTGGYMYVQCRTSVSIDLQAGAQLGTAGGSTDGALDVRASDTLATPTFYIRPPPGTTGVAPAVCPVNYFVPSVRDSLRLFFGVNGIRRTVAPVCGGLPADVPNTALGRWYFGPNYAIEDPNLALVPWNLDPGVATFSIGTLVPGIQSRVLFFSTTASGRVNRDFTTVTADGLIYCYMFAAFPGSYGDTNGRILIQMPTSTTLTIEYATSGTCDDPTSWGFTSRSASFAR